jgi:hypothetical protein
MVKNMINKLPGKMKKRFYIIVFIVFPVLFSIGLFLSTKIAIILEYHVDSRGILFLVISLIPLYFMCIFTVYRVLLKKSQNK